MQGILALDIDGTLVHDLEGIPYPIVRYLTHLSQAGWRVMFLTGRTFTFAYHVLKELPFPYVLSVQNGAVTLDMPKKAILNRYYLDRSILPVVEKIFIEEGTGPIIYGGFEVDDLCYYRKELLSADMNAYLKIRQGTFLEVWEELQDYSEMPVEQFPSLKCFGSERVARRVSEKLKQLLDVEVSVISDPFDPCCFLAQATNPQANKGKALQGYRDSFNRAVPVIAAGDDYNDISMLQVADTKIVMEGAPEVLLGMADILAPPSKATGILPALKRAVHRYE